MKKLLLLLITSALLSACSGNSSSSSGPSSVPFSNDWIGTFRPSQRSCYLDGIGTSVGSINNSSWRITFTVDHYTINSKDGYDNWFFVSEGNSLRDLEITLPQYTNATWLASAGTIQVGYINRTNASCVDTFIKY